MVTASKRKLRNALKFGTTREVDSKERVATAEELLLPPPNYSEVGTPQVDLDRVMGEALILQPRLQRLRTKLIFDVRIDNPFFD